MLTDRTEQALQRLDAAMTRAEAAAEAIALAMAEPAELARLQERHSRLRQSVAQSLRQLDDILTGFPGEPGALSVAQ